MTEKICLRTSSRLSRWGKPEVPADAETRAQGAGRFSHAPYQRSRKWVVHLTRASCLFSPLVLPGRSSVLDSPSLFLDLLGAFSERPAADRKQLSVGRAAPVTRLAAVRLGQRAEIHRLSQGWGVMGPEVGMRRWKGCLCFLTLPDQELLTWGIWRAQGACGHSEVMHKVHWCTGFCSDKIKCPVFTPSEYFIIVSSLSRSCVLEQNTAAVISSHSHCYQTLVSQLSESRESGGWQGLKTSYEVPRINSIWLYSTGTF